MFAEAKKEEKADAAPKHNLLAFSSGSSGSDSSGPVSDSWWNQAYLQFDCQQSSMVIQVGDMVYKNTTNGSQENCMGYMSQHSCRETREKGSVTAVNDSKISVRWSVKATRSTNKVEGSDTGWVDDSSFKKKDTINLDSYEANKGSSYPNFLW